MLSVLVWQSVIDQKNASEIGARSTRLCFYLSHFLAESDPLVLSFHQLSNEETGVDQHFPNRILWTTVLGDGCRNINTSISLFTYQFGKICAQYSPSSPTYRVIGRMTGVTRGAINAEPTVVNQGCPGKTKTYGHHSHRKHKHVGSSKRSWHKPVLLQHLVESLALGGAH